MVVVVLLVLKSRAMASSSLLAGFWKGGRAARSDVFFLSAHADAAQNCGYFIV